MIAKSTKPQPGACPLSAGRDLLMGLADHQTTIDRIQDYALTCSVSSLQHCSKVPSTYLHHHILWLIGLTLGYGIK